MTKKEFLNAIRDLPDSAKILIEPIGPGCQWESILPGTLTEAQVRVEDCGGDMPDFAVVHWNLKA